MGEVFGLYGFQEVFHMLWTYNGKSPVLVTERLLSAYHPTAGLLLYFGVRDLGFGPKAGGEVFAISM